MFRIIRLRMRLDALIVREPLSVVEEMVNFSRLPYFDGAGDANADTAYISENFVSQPFQNENLVLQPGVHLHWSLPTDLTHGRDDPQQRRLVFPPVPTRWLIWRAVGMPGFQRVDRRWIVESDYLYPATPQGMNAGLDAGAVTFPIHSQPGRTDPPFRYMGRQMHLSDWLEQDPDQHEYLDTPLTAIGYGEPAFAAFYPNSRSIFGFHDPEIVPGAWYNIAGWYTNAGAQDAALAMLTLPKEEEAEAQVEPRPVRLYCQADLSIDEAMRSEIQGEPIRSAVAIGNTPSEALSAYLAHQHADGSGDRRRLEEQLEALHLAADLHHRTVDAGYKFKEARHEKQFQASAGGLIWRLRPVHGQAGASLTPGTFTLPLELAALLNELNEAQQVHDAASFVLESWRERTFADWHRYMQAAYPAPGEQGDFPDPDHIRYFITAHDLIPFQEQARKVALLHEKITSTLANLGQRLPELQLFTAADVTNLAALTQQIRAQKEPILVRLGAMLPADGAPADPARLVNLLNDLLQYRSLGARLPFPGSPPPEAQQLDPHRQALRYNRLLLQAHLPALARRPDFELQRTAAPRFWEPREPVVLLVGEEVEPTDRYNDAEPRFFIEITEEHDPVSRDSLAALPAPDASAPAGGSIPDHRVPWQPLFLEWEVALLPRGGEKSNIPQKKAGDSRHKAYDEDFLTANYRLGAESVDLEPAAAASPPAHADCVYSGRSILSARSVPLLRQQLDNYLTQRLVPAYYAANEVPDAMRTPGYFAAHRQTILHWYRNQGERDPYTDQMLFVDEALGDDFHALAQALGGFNDALLGHKQMMQLPVTAPLAFPPFDDFTDQMQHAVGRSNRVAPQPQNPFVPIRTGHLHLRQLRLVNNFGIVRRVQFDQVLAADVMHVPDEPAKVSLPPRFVQPLRLDWRWLAAEGDRVERTRRPVATPVCGWLLANNLDGSLLIYDGAGQALGALNLRDGWWPAPAAATAVATPEAIANPHLRRVVQWLHRPDGADLLAHFISTLDSALENIEPDAYQHHEGLALLIGRPLAVVRASAGLSLRGLPALNQNWNLFRRSLVSGERFDDNVEKVRVPLRLGEHRQLNDGLAGYWTEIDGALSTHFYSPQSEPADLEHQSGLILTHGPAASDQPLPPPLVKAQGHQGIPNLELTLGGPQQQLTLLIDPRGSVHATCGLLPTAVLSLPDDQVAAALAAIEPTFFTAPVLSSGRTFALPLPEEPGYSWRWLERSGTDDWLQIEKIGKVQPQARFVQGQTTAREGWLRLSPTQSPTSPPPDDSPSEELPK